MADLSFDNDSHTLRIDGVRVDLVGREVDAFAYLYANAGRTVSRQEMEQKVWGMRAGARSETVPVTVRRLRNKLGENADTWLQTVRGIGWRFVKPRTSNLPSFGTPFQARDKDEARVRALWEAGWRIVSLVGPGGAGKTRLAAEISRQLNNPVVFAAMGSAAHFEDALRILCSAAGLMSGDLAVFERTMAEQHTWVVIDEAEIAFEPVRELVTRLANTRFLITSRRELGVPGEAVHAVGPLVGAEASNFLRSRLEASRWHADLEESWIDRAVRMLDGLPLAMEVAAAHPDLPSLITSLERREIPAGPEGAQLTATLDASLARLDAGTLDVLRSLCLCEGPLRESEITEWLGSEALAPVRDLAKRSLISRQDGGWIVLRTTRVSVRNTEADWPRLQENFDRWLVARARFLGDQTYYKPSEIAKAFRPRIEDMQSALFRIPLDVVPDFALAIARYLRTSGPSNASLPFLRKALERAPTNLRLQTLAVLHGQARDLQFLDLAETCEDAATRQLALSARAFLDPNSMREETLRSAILTSEREVERLSLQRILLHHLFKTDPSVVEETQALANRAERCPGMATNIYQTLAAQRLSLGQIDLATAAAERSVAIAQQHELLNSEQNAQATRALVVWERNPESSVAILLDTAKQGDRLGQPTWYHRGLAGIILYSLGSIEASQPLLETAEEGPLPPHRFNRAFLLALRMRLDDGSALADVEGLETLPTLFVNQDGTPTTPILLAYIRGEAQLFRARRAGTETDMLQSLLAEREGDDGPGRCRLIRDLHRDWTRRYEHLNGR